jgi:hypothetical protein
MGTRGTAVAKGTWTRQRLASARRKFEATLITTAILCAGFVGGCAGLVSGSKTTTGLAAFQVNPTALNFGSVGVGKKATQTIAVANTGTMPVSITRATLSNPQFSLTGVTLPMSIGTGQSGNFTVGVTPSTAGALTATLTVQGSDGAAPATVNLSATAVAPAPQISLSSTSVQFGTVGLGSTSNLNVTISNTGTADLTISVVSLIGAEFSVSGITTPKTFTAGQSAPVTLTFKPIVGGAAAATLTITSNDAVNPTTSVALTGTGSNAAFGQLQANPASVSFGSVSRGSNATQQVTVSNTGTDAVHISGIAVTGAGFSANGIATPFTLNAAATAILNVAFAPTAGGSASGSVTVTSDATNSPLTFSLAGTGAQPGVSVTPGNFAFGNVVDGQTKSQTLTLTNTGSAALTISQVSVSGAGYSLSGLVTPSTVAAGASTTFSATFAPTTAASLPGTITITSNAPTSPSTVALTGTGVAGTVILSANPTSLTFGNVNSGVASSKSVTLTNSGTGNVTISQITVNAKDTTTSGVTLPVTLTPGQIQTMIVAFQPMAQESVSGNITVTNSQGTNTVVAVSGTGVQAGISLTPSSTDFGSVTVGATNSQTIQIRNTGNGVLTITQANVTGTGFSVAGLTLPLSINPGLTSGFNAQYQPASAGSASGSISIVSNAAVSPSVVTLTGTGVTPTEILSLSTTSISFGSIDTGTSSTQTVSVTNTGNANVQISQIAVIGTGYSLSGASTPITLTPSQKLTFSVIFNPTVTGSASGTVTITSNATGSPTTMTLSGSGVTPVPHTVGLSWTASTSSVSGYNVYRSTTSGTGYTKLNGGLVATESYTDSTVANGTTYYYVTTAVDGSGNESTDSNEAVAIIP